MSHTSIVSTLRAKDLVTYVVETVIFIICRVARDLSPVQNMHNAFLKVSHPQHSVLMRDFSFSNILCYVSIKNSPVVFFAIY
jgi:hypothetical protein